MIDPVYVKLCKYSCSIRHPTDRPWGAVVLRKLLLKASSLKRFPYLGPHESFQKWQLRKKDPNLAGRAEPCARRFR